MTGGEPRQTEIRQRVVRGAEFFQNKQCAQDEQDIRRPRCSTLKTPTASRAEQGVVGEEKSHEEIINGSVFNFDAPVLDVRSGATKCDEATWQIRSPVPVVWWSGD
jgi:hypothetical protein